MTTLLADSWVESLKAPQILSAVITGGLGLMVFAGTQWVLHRREETKLLREKLEALYKATSRMAELQVERLKYYEGDDDLEMFKSIYGGETSDEIAMLQAFYFPQLKQPILRLLEQNSFILGMLRGKGKAESLKEITEAISELNRIVEEIAVLLRTRRRSLTSSRWWNYLPFCFRRNLEIRSYSEIEQESPPP